MLRLTKYTKVTPLHVTISQLDGTLPSSFDLEFKNISIVEFIKAPIPDNIIIRTWDGGKYQVLNTKLSRDFAYFYWEQLNV